MPRPQDHDKTLVVIPARGGSNGIPLKNLREIGGKSLVRLAVECAHAAGLEDIWVSSDHPDILKEAVASGAIAYERPDELATGSVGDAAVLRNAYRATNLCYDTIVMLQPTSPLRKPEHVIGALGMMKGGYDSVWTVSPTPLKYHPLKALTVESYGLDIWDADSGLEIIRRQQLTPTYHRNGVAYAMTRDCLMDYGTMGERCGAYVIEDEQVSIDTEDDLKRAEQLWSIQKLRA